MQRVLNTVNSGLNGISGATSPSSGRHAAHAEVMELRRLQRAASMNSRTSNYSGQIRPDPVSRDGSLKEYDTSLGHLQSPSPSHAAGKGQGLSPAMSMELQHVVEKLDGKLESLSFQVSKCLQDTTYIRTTVDARCGTSISDLYRTSNSTTYDCFGGAPTPPLSPFGLPHSALAKGGTVHAAPSKVPPPMVIDDSDPCFYPNFEEEPTGSLPIHRKYVKASSSIPVSVKTSEANSDKLAAVNNKRSSDPILPPDASPSLARVRNRDARAKVAWSFLENPGIVPGSLLFARSVSLLILVSSIMTFIQTGDEAPFDHSTWFEIELVFDVIFCAEVVVRFLVCPNRITFVLNPYNLIDIVSTFTVAARSIAADTVNQEERNSNSWLLALSCTVPVLRLLKLLRRFQTFHLITNAFRLACEALPVLIFILSVLVLTFASAIFVVEPRSNVESLPRALWFTIVTVGTVGYGDMVPVTTPGNIVVSILIVVSALYMAIPIGIVGKTFSAVWDDRDRFLLMHRTRSLFLEHGYKASDIPIMFCSFDHNNDGELDFQEFTDMMEYLQIDLGETRLLDLFGSFDVDDSGSIDDREFVRLLFPSAFAEIYGRTSLKGSRRTAGRRSIPNIILEGNDEEEHEGELEADSSRPPVARGSVKVVSPHESATIGLYPLTRPDWPAHEKDVKMEEKKSHEANELRPPIEADI